MATAWVWRNGGLIPATDATMPVGSSAIHFGPNAFEGIRCRPLGAGRSGFFRLADHLARLHASAATMHLDLPYSVDELTRACIDTVVANDHPDAYVRPVVFPGSASLGFGRPAGPAEVCILSFPWSNRPLERSQERGITLHVSSVTRTQGHPSMSKSKISANYAAGLMAIHQAQATGCDDALLLDAAGAVAEGSTANVVAVWGDQVATPPLDLPILAGITRDTLLCLAHDEGIEMAESSFDVADLARADEVFLCGTSAEVTPVRAIDGRPVGAGDGPGPRTARFLGALLAAVHGTGTDRGWITPVEWAA